MSLQSFLSDRQNPEKDLLTGKIRRNLQKGGVLAALPMTTKLSEEIQEVITRRLQSKIHHFFSSCTRKVLFERHLFKISREIPCQILPVIQENPGAWFAVPKSELCWGPVTTASSNRMPITTLVAQQP